MVTAEFAVALPALIAVVLAAMYAISVVSVQLRCTDAAATAVRLAARGESGSVIGQAARAAGPAGSQLRLAWATDTVTAVVADTVRPAGLTRLLPGVRVSARVVAAREPAAAGD